MLPITVVTLSTNFQLLACYQPHCHNHSMCRAEHVGLLYDRFLYLIHCRWYNTMVKTTHELDGNGIFS